MTVKSEPTCEEKEDFGSRGLKDQCSLWEFGKTKKSVTRNCPLVGGQQVPRLRMVKKSRVTVR